ncbi:MAG: FG-GAP-like repeat-containing protein, partial [Mariprofundaceae bacterium]
AAPTFTDLDGDGDLDVFVGEYNGTVKFYQNDGTGVFTASNGTTIVNPLAGFDVGFKAAPTFTDLDGDGDLDVFVGEYNGTVKFYQNDGTGVFTASNGTTIVNPLAGFDVGGYATPTFADIDGDGDLDAFVGENLGTVKFYQNDGTGVFTASNGTTIVNPLSGFDVGYTATPTFADIDGDGDLDAFVGEYYGTVSFYQNNGAAGFVASNGTTIVNPLAGFGVGYRAAPTFADIDGDGDLDVFVGERYGTVKFFENFDPTPQVVTPVQPAAPAVDRSPPVITVPGNLLVGAVDFNGVPATDADIATFLDSATAVDAVSGIVAVTHDAPTQFPVGATAVTFSAADSRGNTRTVTVIVTVSGTQLGSTFVSDSGTDSDGDGLSDAREKILGSDPNSTDTDGDGAFDLAESGFMSVPFIGSANIARDSDGDGVFDLNESLETSNDASRVSGVASPDRSVVFDLDAGGQNISGVSVSEHDASAPGTVIPNLGTLSYQVAVDVGGTAVVSIHADVALPDPLELYKVDADGVYTLIDASHYTVIDANTVSLTLVDGGILDLDGEANGVIVDPIAFAQAEVVETPPLEPTTETPDTEPTPTAEATNTGASSSGGGCLVSTSTGGNLWLLPIAGLMLLGMTVVGRREKLK